MASKASPTRDYEWSWALLLAACALTVIVFAGCALLWGLSRSRSLRRAEAAQEGFAGGRRPLGRERFAQQPAGKGEAIMSARGFPLIDDACQVMNDRNAPHVMAAMPFLERHPDKPNACMFVQDDGYPTVMDAALSACTSRGFLADDRVVASVGPELLSDTRRCVVSFTPGLRDSEYAAYEVASRDRTLQRTPTYEAKRQEYLARKREADAQQEVVSRQEAQLKAAQDERDAYNLRALQARKRQEESRAALEAANKQLEAVQAAQVEQNKELARQQQVLQANKDALDTQFKSGQDASKAVGAGTQQAAERAKLIADLIAAATRATREDLKVNNVLVRLQAVNNSLMPLPHA